MILEHEIREQLVALLERRVALDDFQDWLVERSWNMHLDSAAAAQDLVSGVELVLAEHSSHHLSEFEFRAKLLDLLDEVVVSLHLDMPASSPPRVITANSAGPPRTVRALVPA